MRLEVAVQSNIKLCDLEEGDMFLAQFEDKGPVSFCIVHSKDREIIWINQLHNGTFTLDDLYRDIYDDLKVTKVTEVEYIKVKV